MKKSKNLISVILSVVLVLSLMLAVDTKSPKAMAHSEAPAALPLFQVQDITGQWIYADGSCLLYFDASGAYYFEDTDRDISSGGEYAFDSATTLRLQSGGKIYRAELTEHRGLKITGLAYSFYRS